MALGRGFAAYAEGKGRQMSAQYGGTRARERRIAPCTMRHRRSGMSDVSSTRPAGAVRMIGAMAVARPCMESAYSSMLCKNVPGRPGRSSGAPIALERTLSRRTCDGGSAQRGARARTASRRARTCEATCAHVCSYARRTTVTCVAHMGKRAAHQRPTCAHQRPLCGAPGAPRARTCTLGHLVGPGHLVSRPFLVKLQILVHSQRACVCCVESE